MRMASMVSKVQGPEWQRWITTDEVLEAGTVGSARALGLGDKIGKFTYEGSAEKVWAPEHGVRTTEAITQMLGPYAQLLNGSPHAIRSGLFAHNLMGAFQSGINHGSVQVMRDQVARRGLELPRARRAG